MFRKNPASIVMAGVIGFGAFAVAKFAGNLIGKGIARIAGGSSAPAIAPAAGFGSIEALSSPLGNVLAAIIGVPLVLKFAPEDMKAPAATGIAVSALQSLALALLGAVHPGARAVLSGDAEAVRLAAMYGMGASIMPRYAPINGMGEYFASGVNGMGEYFESGVEGLGNYVGNQDLMQAAAGYGALEAGNTNHIDPSSNLDRELTIAEAAAGVGVIQQAAAGIAPYAAQAGMGEYFASGMSGLGAVANVPSADTWIPGMADPQIWAGTRAVNQPQSATEMTPAGVLSSPGSQGVFG